MFCQTCNIPHPLVPFEFTSHRYTWTRGFCGGLQNVKRAGLLYDRAQDAYDNGYSRGQLQRFQNTFSAHNTEWIVRPDFIRSITNRILSELQNGNNVTITWIKK